MNTIRALRKQLGLTQEELGNQIGKTKAYISSLENGKRNISQIAAGTLVALAETLHTTAEELIDPPADIDPNDFEFEDGRLIVDRIFYDPSGKKIIEIDGLYYLLKNGYIESDKPIEGQVRRLKKEYGPEYDDGSEHYYVTAGCVPRVGYNIELKREITPSELEELCKKYNLGEDDMSGEFECVCGNVYGEKYRKVYTAIQIRATDAIALESELQKKGIQTSSAAPGRVNIRVK